MKRWLLALILAFGAASGARADIQSLVLNYQGQLTNLSDVAINGSHNFSFIVYSVPSGGSGLWSSAANAVTVNQGLFQVQLPIPIGSSANQITPTELNGLLYLEVTVDGQTMAPRTQLLASMFAYNADLLQGLAPNNQPNNIPVLDNNGHLVGSAANVSVAFPFSETGTGAGFGYAINAQNTDIVSGQNGITSQGYNGLSATAASASGIGVIGQSSSGDNAASIGIEGQANQGIGVDALSNSGIGLKAQSSAANSPAILASDASGLGLVTAGTNGEGVSASNTGIQVGGGSFSGQTLTTPQTGINIASSGNGIVIANVGTGYGVNASNSSSLAALNGTNPSANGIGVSGANNQASSGAQGFGVGTYGSSNSASGFGVKGEALAISGANYGVYGDTASSNGVGVYGTGPARGVQGAANNSNSIAVYGINSGAGAIGVQGESDGTGTGFGVYGIAQSTSGAGVFGSSPNYGVYGSSSGNGASSYGVYGNAASYGVVGSASSSSGNAWGVMGQAAASNGVGVEGQALGAGSGTRAGLEGIANGTGGTGYGVYGQGDNVGVYGFANGTDGGDEYGLEGYVQGSGSNRFGVYGSVNANPGELVYGVFGELTENNNTGIATVGSNDSAAGIGVLASNPNNEDSSTQGSALALDGRIKFLEDNAGTYTSTILANQTNFVVPATYCGANDIVIVVPRFDINLVQVSGGGSVDQDNAMWVQSVQDGSFTVAFSKPIAGVNLGGQNSFYINYLIIGK